MGSFFNTVFSILLGWLQGLVSMIWNAFTLREGESFLQYIGKNWIVIAAILCAAGLALDFTVYIFRWEPYKVWQTAWRRMRNNRKNRDPEEADPDITPDIRYDEKESEPDYGAYGSDADDLPDERDEFSRWRGTREEYAAASDSAPPDITRAGYVVPADSPYRRPAAAGADDDRNGSGSRTRRRSRFSAILGDNDEDNQFRYFAPKPVIDQHKAYREPVYPEKWKESRESDS